MDSLKDARNKCFVVQKSTKPQLSRHVLRLREITLGSTGTWEHWDLGRRGPAQGGAASFTFQEEQWEPHKTAR